MIDGINTYTYENYLSERKVRGSNVCCGGKGCGVRNVELYVLKVTNPFNTAYIPFCAECCVKRGITKEELRLRRLYEHT